MNITSSNVGPASYNVKDLSPHTPAFKYQPMMQAADSKKGVTFRYDGNLVIKETLDREEQSPRIRTLSNYDRKFLDKIRRKKEMEKEIGRY